MKPLTCEDLVMLCISVQAFVVQTCINLALPV